MIGSMIVRALVRQAIARDCQDVLGLANDSKVEIQPRKIFETLFDQKALKFYENFKIFGKIRIQMIDINNNPPRFFNVEAQC